MIQIFTFLFDTLPCILAWLYFVFAAIYIAMHMKQVVNKAEISIKQWLFFILTAGYALFFLIARIFFVELWENVFTFLGIIAIIISAIWTIHRQTRRQKMVELVI